MTWERQREGEGAKRKRTTRSERVEDRRKEQAAVVVESEHWMDIDEERAPGDWYEKCYEQT